MMSVLKMMSLLVPLFCLCFSQICFSASEIDFQYDRFLDQYVKDGVVDYRGMKGDSSALDQYLKQAAALSADEFSVWDEEKRLAFLFNLYNAATVRMILDHYPVESIKDIGSFFKGPWDQKVVQLFGETTTLDVLEHDILRKEYNEPRLHMTLVCAAKACPPLRNELYTADRLNEQMDDQTVLLLKHPLKFKIDREQGIVYFSSIFKWFGDDFIKNYSPSVGFDGLNKKEKAIASFCANYLQTADKEYLMSGNYRVKYLDYDWSLNE